MKLLQNITIILFIVVSLLVWLCGCNQRATELKKTIAAQDSTYAVAVATHDSLMKELNKSVDRHGQLLGQLDSLLLIHAAYQRCLRMRDKYEILYLRTENDRYRLIGNKYVDSANYWGRIGLKLAAKQ